MLRDLSAEEAQQLAQVNAALRGASAGLALERRAAALMAKGMPEAEARTAAAASGNGRITRDGTALVVINDPGHQLQLVDGSAITMVEFLRETLIYPG